MANPNTYVLLQNAKQEIARLRVENEFGFSPERCAAFEAAFRKTFIQYAEMCVKDWSTDEEIWYTKEKVDRALRQACGDGIMSFDERYAPENLYLRTRDLKEEKC